MNPSSKSCLAEIRKHTILVVALFSLLQLGFGVLAVHDLFSAMPSLLYRDSASFVSRMIELESARGVSAEAAFATASREVTELVPGSVLFLLGADGAVLHATGPCRLTVAHIPQQFLETFFGPEQGRYPKQYPPVCEEGEQFLSASFLGDLPRPLFVVMAATAPALPRYLWTSKGCLHFLWWATCPLVVLLGWFVASFAAFKRFFFAPLISMTGVARAFANGNHSVRFAPGEFPEHEDVATAFNTLAEEVSERAQKLVREDSERREVMAGLAHDLRTPMTAIDGCVEFLARQELSGAKRAEYAELIETSLSAQEHLAGKLSELAMLEYDPTLENTVRCDPREILVDAERILKSIAESKQVILATSYPNVETELQCNPELLKRAILNLGHNAIQATPAGKRVTLSVRRGGESTTIFEVQDEGCGAVDEEMSNVHLGAIRGRSTVSGRHGLGLAIVEKIAAFHHGRTWIERSSSQGTNIRFEVPNSRPRKQDCRPEPLKLPASAARKLKHRYPAFVSNVFIAWGLGLAAAEVTNGSSMGLRVAGAVLGILLLVQHFIAPRLRLVAVLGSLAAISYVLALEVVLARSYLCGGAILAGVMTTLALLRITAWWTRLLAVVAVLAAPPWVLAHPWNFMLGGGTAAWIESVFWFVEAALIQRRATPWLAGVLFIGVGFSSIVNAGAMYAFVVRASCAVSQADTGRITRWGTSKLSAVSPQSDAESELMIKASIVNPTVDYELVSPAGTVLCAAGTQTVARDEARFREFLAQRKAFFTENEFELSNFHRTFFGTSMQRGSETSYLTLAAPSTLLHALTVRGAEAFSIPLVMFQVLAGLIVFIPLERLWGKATKSRVTELRTGIQRFQLGDYATPIDLPLTDELGMLGAELSDLAARIPRLEEEINHGRKLQSVFLQFGADAVNSCVQSMRSAMDLTAAAAQLRSTIETLFEYTYLSRIDRLDALESLSLSDVLFDTIQSLKPVADSRNIGFVVNALQTACMVACVPQTVTEGVKDILINALERTAPGGVVHVQLQRQNKLLELTVTDGGLRLTSRQVDCLLEAFEPNHTLLPTGDGSLLVLSGRLSLLKRKLQLSGGDLLIAQNEIGLECLVQMKSWQNEVSSRVNK